MPAQTAQVLYLDVAADGAHLQAVTDAGRAFRWDVRPASWGATPARSPGAG